MNILIVDHDTERRDQLERILRADGHSVRSRADGRAGFRTFLQEPTEVVFAGETIRRRRGFDLFRRVRSRSQRGESYLISVETGERRGRKPRKTDALDDEGVVDDLLVEPITAGSVHARLRVGRQVLRARAAEAVRARRLSQVPADSPHPILELTPAGVLVHANLACMPLLEAWGWTMGRPIPAPFRHLAMAAASSVGAEPKEIVCGGRPHRFTSAVLEGGDICLYGHEMISVPSRDWRPDAVPGRTPEATRGDPLTGLPSSSRFGERLCEELRHARSTGSRVALVKVDIDNCSDINDAYGHSVGDRVIAHVAGCLRGEIRVGDSLFRDTGDGFVVVLQGVANRQSAGAICGRLLKSVQKRGEGGEIGVRFTLSIGLALFPDDGDDEETLIERADLALGEAKHAGRNCWRDFRTAEGTNPLLGSDRLLPKLMAAVHSREMVAHYQPIVDASNRRVASFEALVRWHEPTLGWVAPDVFIPLAESRGLISEIGRQMADLVFRQLADWRAAGHEINAALNISKQQLLDHEFLRDIERVAEEHRVAPAWVVLEVTERQSLLNDRQCRECLDGLANAGFRLSLDDFGSGHSTFDVVSELPFHELKVNMALGRKVVTPRGRHILRAILAMCEELGLESVVEGIEDADLGRQLRQVGADKLQGYHFSPPIPGGETLRFLSDWDRTRRRSSHKNHGVDQRG